MFTCLRSLGSRPSLKPALVRINSFMRTARASSNPHLYRDQITRSYSIKAMMGVWLYKSLPRMKSVGAECRPMNARIAAIMEIGCDGQTLTDALLINILTIEIVYDICVLSDSRRFCITEFTRQPYVRTFAGRYRQPIGNTRVLKLCGGQSIHFDIRWCAHFAQLIRRNASVQPKSGGWRL